MNLKEATYTISFSNDELEELGYCLYYHMKETIDNHYNKLQQNQDGEPVFFEHNEKRLKMMDFFFTVCGNKRISEMHIKEFKRMFEEKRKEREEQK